MKLTSSQRKLMRKWITKLRSREYKQGEGELRQVGPTERSVDRFCCLGVLCDIHNPKFWNLYDDNSIDYKLPKMTYGETSSLPAELLEKIGLSPEEQRNLINMNDTGKKFYEIANYLERKYLSNDR